MSPCANLAYACLGYRICFDGIWLKDLQTHLLLMWLIFPLILMTSHTVHVEVLLVPCNFHLLEYHLLEVGGTGLRLQATEEPFPVQSNPAAGLRRSEDLCGLLKIGPRKEVQSKSK